MQKKIGKQETRPRMCIKKQKGDNKIWKAWEKPHQHERKCARTNNDDAKHRMNEEAI